jgi:hypothetical protein
LKLLKKRDTPKRKIYGRTNNPATTD